MKSFFKMTIVFITAVFLVGAFYYNKVTQEVELENSQRLTRIPFSDLGFENVELKTDPNYGNNFSYNLYGRVKNNSSKYNLYSVEIVITMEDCTNVECVIIGETKVSIHPNMPHGQSRDFKQGVRFSDNFDPRGTLRWHYSVSQTIATIKSL